MASDEIVDISGARLQQRRQLLRRVGGPVLGVALVTLSILGISLYSYRANRANALVLSGALLSGLQAHIAGEVNNYFSPATRAVLLARDMVARTAIANGQAALEGFAASMLNQVPHLEGFYTANGNGDFVMVRRDPAGGTDTKLIVNDPGARQVSSVHLDEAGRVLDRSVMPGDDFDPRQRVWYKGALETDGVYWSSPYIFYTTRAPGITASIRFKRSGTVDRVFGVDITLEALTDFLASLRIGHTGRAAIVDSNGTVIAAPSLAHAQGASSGGEKALKTIASLNDPALTGAYDRFRVEGFGNHTITVSGTPYVAITSRLPTAGQNWVLLIAAPQSDFTGLAESTSRTDLLLSLTTIGLAAFLGSLLVRQNRRADRLARQLAQAHEATARATRTLSNLATQPGLFDPQQPALGLTESLAEMSAARRASIWRLARDTRVLHCEDLFEQRGGHVEGLELSRSELPHFFHLLDQGEAVDEVDAATDSRTGEVHRLLMRPFGSRKLSVLPVRGPSGGVSGAVLLEDASEPERGRGFAQVVSSIAAMRIHGHATERDTALQSASADGAEPDPLVPATDNGDGRAFSSMLVADGIDPSELGATHFPAVTAMSVSFDDAVCLARTDQTGLTALADEIAKAMQAIATRYTLPYMKVTGHIVVAAVGCTETPDPTATARLADAALATREICLSLLTQAGLEPVFRIGIDYGAAFGSALGQAPRVFNLWGDTIRTAELMAQSAVDIGSIQVSERAYEQLRRQFLFRARGVFYVPRVGTARTFILAARR